MIIKNKISYSLLIALLVTSAFFSIIGSADHGVCAAERTSASYSIETDSILGGGTSGESSSSYQMEVGAAGEVAETGSAEAIDYEAYFGYVNTLGTDPNDPQGLGQYKSDGSTIIATGEWIKANTVVIKFTMSDPDPTNDLYPQVEVKAVGTPFTGVPSYTGAMMHFSGTDVTGIVTCSAMSDNQSYHWQARIIDDEYHTSAYVPFGNNTESERDFGIDQTAPTVAVISPNGGETWEVNSLHYITWDAADSGCGVDHIDIYYSLNDGADWTAIATNIANDGTRSWTVPDHPTAEAMVKVVAVDKLGNVGTDESNYTFNIIGTLYPPAILNADATPESGPDHVRLSWSASTSESVDGYNVYRRLTGDTYGPDPINTSVITSLTYDDNPASHTDFYYAVKTVKGGAVGIAYSNDAGAPLVKLTRTDIVMAPKSGGYSGGDHDPVPGAIIIYSIQYENIGYGLAKNIIINDSVPEHTEYKIDSATGNAIITTRFSNDNGNTFTYTPFGAQVDGNVTNISWEAQDLSSGISKMCTYEVVIK